MLKITKFNKKICPVQFEVIFNQKITHKIVCKNNLSKFFPQNSAVAINFRVEMKTERNVQKYKTSSLLFILFENEVTGNGMEG